MPITAQDKKQVLLDAGIDPEKYWITDEGDVIDMPAQGPVEAGAKSALYNAPRAALGFIGSALGAAGAGAAGIPSGPGAVAAGIAGGFGGGYVGANIGEKIQTALYPEGWRFAEEARSIRNPVATQVGNLAVQATMMRPSPSMLKSVAEIPGDILRSGGQISPSRAAAGLNVLLGGALGAGTTLGAGGTAEDAAKEALIGAIFSQPTKLGQKMSFDTFEPWAPAPTARGSTAGMNEAFVEKLRIINENIRKQREVEMANRRAAFDEAVARGEAPMPVEDLPSAEEYGGSGVEKELGVAPSEAWNEYLQSLEGQMKAKFNLTDEVLTTDSGQQAAGRMTPRKSAADEAQIDVSTSGRADTGPHEYLHLLLDDALNNGSPRERTFVERMLRESGLEVVEQNGRRAIKGNLEELTGPMEDGRARSEEELVQGLGEDVVRRAVKPEEFDTLRQAYQDFTDYYLRNRVTPEAARRMLSGRFMYGRGTAPSLGNGTGAVAGTRAAEEIKPAETVENPLAVEQARKAELDRVEAAQLKAENDAREARHADMEAAFAAQEKDAARARMVQNMENLPTSPKRVQLGEDMAKFADTGGEMPAGELPLAEPDQSYDLGNVKPEEVTPGTEVARPETLDYTGESIPANVRRGRAMRESAAESPEDLELRRIEDRLSGRSRSKYQPMAEEEARLREVQVNSPEFKNWFGDSVVKDETGKPKMVYHGTSKDKDFTKFAQNKRGIWFTDNPESASSYAKQNDSRNYSYEGGKIREVNTSDRVYPVYLSIKKPLKVEGEILNKWRTSTNYRKANAELVEYAQRNGYDGLDFGSGNYVAFEPTQVKSAIGNRGTFDPNKADLRYQPLGPEEATYKGAKLPEREQRSRGIFAGNVEALRRSGNPDKAYFAGRADELFAKIRNNVGKYEEAVLKPLLELSEADRKTLVGIMYDEDATGKPIAVAARLRPAYKAIRDGLKLMADDQIKAGQLIGGKTRGVDPTYFPNVVDPTVLHDLTYNSGSKRAAELERQYIEYNTDRYSDPNGRYKYPRAKAAEMAREAFDSFRGALKPMSIEGGFDFGAVTMREGGKLPPTWVSADPVAGFRNYIKRFSRSRAFYDIIQRDERATASLGMKNYYDASGAEKPIAMTAENLARDPNARALMESAIGVTHESQEGITPAIGRLANSLLLSNVMSRVTDAATTPFKALAYVPPSQLPGFIKHMSNIRQSMENAYRSGGVRRGDMMVMRDVLGAGDVFANNLDKAAEKIVKWTGSEAMEKGARFLAQNAGEYIYDVNVALAKRGDKRATEFLDRVTPEWRNLDRIEVSQRIAQLFQGRYDATNLPIWIANSPAAPFFSMMKWNIEQWNNFKRFAWQPAQQGNYVPLISTILGGALGGVAVGELREMITGKKQRVASLDELNFGFAQGDKAKTTLEALRKAAFISQVTGTLGIVGEIGLQAFDIAAKDKPQGFSWPAFEMASNAIGKAQNAASAMVEKPDDVGIIAWNFGNDLLRDNFTQYRLALNALDRAGVDIGTAGGAGQVEESNRRRDLRMSEKLRGEPTRFSPFIEADYANIRERRFDKTRDMKEAREQAKELKADARRGARTPEEYNSALNKLRASRIVGIPSRENNPAQYRAHIKFVLETQGEEAAARLRRTYEELNRQKQIKSSMF